MCVFSEPPTCIWYPDHTGSLDLSYMTSGCQYHTIVVSVCSGTLATLHLISTVCVHDVWMIADNGICTIGTRTLIITRSPLYILYDMHNYISTHVARGITIDIRFHMVYQIYVIQCMELPCRGITDRYRCCSYITVSSYNDIL